MSPEELMAMPVDTMGDARSEREPLREPQEAGWLEEPLEDGYVEADLWALFSALGNKLRMEIVDFLTASPGANAGDIALVLDEPAHHLTRHLRILEKAGVVEIVRQGSFRNYSLRREVQPVLEAARRVSRRP